MLCVVGFAAAGVRAVRRGDTARHRRCMLTAATLVVLFVVSYVVKLATLGREDSRDLGRALDLGAAHPRAVRAHDGAGRRRRALARPAPARIAQLHAPPRRSAGAGRERALASRRGPHGRLGGGARLAARGVRARRHVSARGLVLGRAASRVERVVQRDLGDLDCLRSARGAPRRSARARAAGTRRRSARAGSGRPCWWRGRRRSACRAGPDRRTASPRRTRACRSSRTTGPRSGRRRSGCAPRARSRRSARRRRARRAPGSARRRPRAGRTSRGRAAARAARNSARACGWAPCPGVLATSRGAAPACRRRNASQPMQAAITTSRFATCSSVSRLSASVTCTSSTRK